MRNFFKTFYNQSVHLWQEHFGFLAQYNLQKNLKTGLKPDLKTEKFGSLERIRVFSITAEMTYGIFLHCATFLRKISCLVKAYSFRFYKCFRLKKVPLESLKLHFSTIRLFLTRAFSQEMGSLLFPVDEKWVFESKRTPSGVF